MTERSNIISAGTTACSIFTTVYVADTVNLQYRTRADLKHGAIIVDHAGFGDDLYRAKPERQLG